MALRQTYLSMVAKLPDDVEVILVMRGRGNDELAPSKELLEDFNCYKKEYVEGLEEYQSAYDYAWEKSNYEERFRKQILENSKSLDRLEALSNLAKQKDVYLVCYEGEDKPCHRRILLQLAKEQFHAPVDPSPYEPEVGNSYQPLFD